MNITNCVIRLGFAALTLGAIPQVHAAPPNSLSPTRLVLPNGYRIPQASQQQIPTVFQNNLAAARTYGRNAPPANVRSSPSPFNYTTQSITPANAALAGGYQPYNQYKCVPNVGLVTSSGQCP
jgi:hypothetical protein